MSVYGTTNRQKMPETIVSLGAKLADLTSKVDKLVKLETLETKVETNAGALHDTGVKLKSQDKRISHLENKWTCLTSLRIGIGKII